MRANAVHPRARRPVVGRLLATAALLAGCAPACWAAPGVDELTALIRKDRDRFLAQPSYKLVFQVDSDCHLGKVGYAYRTFTVTDVRRGNDLSVTFHVPQGSFRGHEEDQIERTERRIFFGGACVSFNGYLMTIAPKLLVQHFHNHEYTDYQHINTYKTLPPSAGLVAGELRQPFLPDAIERDPSRYRVRAEAEPVDEVRCWVLERPGVDAIWVDDEGLIRKRELRWGEGLPRSVATHASDFTTAAGAPGVRLPRRIAVQHFANPQLEAKELADKVLYDLEVTLKGAEFGAVTDADFDVKPAAGGLVNDNIRRVLYRVPIPGEKPFEEAIASASLEKTGRSEHRVFFINVLLFGPMLIYFLRTRVRAVPVVAAFDRPA